MSRTFVTVARFTYSSEALIVKGKLESEGIEVFMRDNLTIDIDPLVSNAIGGVRLNVLQEDEIKAREIISSINQYSLTNEGEKINCPSCDSTKVEYYSNVQSRKSLFHFLFGFIVSGLPFYSKYQYQCEDCSTNFDLNE